MIIVSEFSIPLTTESFQLMRTVWDFILLSERTRMIRIKELC